MVFGENGPALGISVERFQGAAAAHRLGLASELPGAHAPSGVSNLAMRIKL